MRGDFVACAGDLLGDALGGFLARRFALVLDGLLPALKQSFRAGQTLLAHFFRDALQRFRGVRRGCVHGALRVALDLRFQFAQQRALGRFGFALSARDGPGESKSRHGRFFGANSFSHFAVAVEYFWHWGLRFLVGPIPERCFRYYGKRFAGLQP